MKKQLVALLLCIIFLAGCSSTIGKVADVQCKANNETIVQFEDGRMYTFKNQSDIPIHEGAYVTIEYTENAIGSLKITGVIDHSGHTSSTCPAAQYKLQPKSKKLHSSKSDLNVIICPRCQNTLEKGTDY